MHIKTEEYQIKLFIHEKILFFIKKTFLHCHMQRFKFLFCMLINIEKNIKNGNYDLIIKYYAQVVKNLFKKTEVIVFKKTGLVQEELSNIWKLGQSYFT